ncbi:MAG: 50S ribosomal protein L9 [Desulforegulaceae bacterium]|jgi:large subunit ribosomal protein L9|nr:50S ribosomal protein L9 [Desulforegulaceae bacterium]
MKVILKETISSLGIIGSEVNVADGYARNYLLPQKKAVLATDANRKLMEQEAKKVQAQIAKEKEIAEEMAKRLEGVKCEIRAKVAEENRLYGSVTIQDIIDELEKQDVSIEKRMLLLTKPIKEIGEYSIPVRIYKDVEPEITIIVLPEE